MRDTYDTVYGFGGFDDDTSDHMDMITLDDLMELSRDRFSLYYADTHYTYLTSEDRHESYE